MQPSWSTQGVEKVIQEQGGFAFMMEDAGIQYIVERNCELAQVGGNLDTKGYGIATRPDSGFKDLLDSVSTLSPDWRPGPAADAGERRPLPPQGEVVEAEAGRRALPHDRREGCRGEAPQPHRPRSSAWTTWAASSW